MENTTDTLQIKITEARNLLSKESKEAIDNVNWRLVILEMNKKYSPEQLENLETETELLLCGILNPENYSKELESRMQITKEEMDLLIGEMDKLIFKRIQEDLEKKLTVKEKVIINKPLVFDPRFLNMPKDVEEAIALSNWKENLYKIAQKHKLTVEQMGVLEEVTIKVIKNEIHPDKYEEELASKIIIAKEDISNLVKDVNEEILKKIRESMRNQKNEDKIPLPPYAKLINNDQLIINNEKEIPKQVEKLEEVIIPKPIEPTPETIIPPQNIMEEKLKSATVSDHTISDYSSPKTHDPYREVF